MQRCNIELSRIKLSTENNLYCKKIGRYVTKDKELSIVSIVKVVR